MVQCIKEARAVLAGLMNHTFELSPRVYVWCVLHGTKETIKKELSSCSYASETQTGKSQINTHMKELRWQCVHPCCPVEVR